MTLTDLTHFTYRPDRVARMSVAKRVLVGPYRKIAERIQGAADAYVLFARDMHARLGVESTPSMVMEGIFNPEGLDVTSAPSLDRPIIAHAGTLDRQLGVPLILDSFEHVRNPAAQLWLIGSGDMNEEIERRALRDPRIRFFGFVPRSRVFELLCEARILVNLRDPGEEFTRYSFPSKLFEFLATGVPVASTRLRGIPEGYFDYVIPIDSLDPKLIGDALETAMRWDVSVLRHRGEQGRTYVVKQKSAYVQTRY